MATSEALLQQTLVKMLAQCYPDIVTVLSLSGTRLHGTPKQKAQILSEWYSQGFIKGIFDLQLLLPESKLLNLELKKPFGGTQSPDQKLMESRLHSLGHNYHIIRDIPTVFKLIAESTTTLFRTKQYESYGSKLPIRGIKAYYHI